MDLVDILRRGRHRLTNVRVIVTAERAAVDPRRFERVQLSFLLRGSVPAEAVERALELSRDTYCSAWHSMRQEITLETTFELADE